MSFCLHVPSSHSVPSFAHTTARPLTCTCTACLQPRFQGAQALTMRSGSWLSLCIWFPLHHNLLSCLLMSSSLCLLCAHTCTFVRPQVFGPLTWGARVCVCVSTPVLKDFTPIFMTALVGLSFGTTLSDFPSMQQGDAGDFHGRHPTKTPWTSCDMSQGRLTHVPALSIVKTVHCRVAPVVSKKLVKTPSSLPTFSPFCSAVFGSIESRSNACKVGLHTDPSSCEQQSKRVCVCETLGVTGNQLNFCRGMERTYEAPSNQAPHHQGRLTPAS